MYDPNALLRHTTLHTHSYHTAPNTLCGFFIPPVKLLFISPSRPSLNPTLPHTCFIFSPTPTSLCLIVSITYLCLYEHSYSFVFLKRNTALRSLQRMQQCTIFWLHRCQPRQTRNMNHHSHGRVWQRCANQTEQKSTRGVCHVWSTV